MNPIDREWKDRGVCPVHGEYKIKISEFCKDLEEWKRDSEKLWATMDEKVSVRIFCWIIGTLLFLAIAASGTFAVSQRAIAESNAKEIQENRKTIEEANRKFSEIQGQLKEITIHVEYMRKELDKSTGGDYPREREGSPSRPSR